MKDYEFVEKFMTYVMNVVDQLRQYGEHITNQRVIEKIL